MTTTSLTTKQNESLAHDALSAWEELLGETSMTTTLTLPADAPSLGHAGLPENYWRTVAAINACSRTDLLHDLANRAYCLIHYAIVAKDDTLRYHAQRLRCRAVARIGELLKGMPRRTKTALASTRLPAGCVAAVPREERDRLILADKPPTVTEMAKRGAKLMREQAAAVADAKKRAREALARQRPCRQGRDRT